MKAVYFENNLVKALALKAAQRVDKLAPLRFFSPVRYAEVPEPKLPGPRWLKVKNIACGLCGTDMHLLFMDMHPQVFPAALPGIERKFLGHELVGEVIEIGDEVDNVAVGDRVAMRIDWPSCHQMEIDPPCPQCAAGNYMLCTRLGQKQLPEKNTGGGFSPYMVMHRSQPFVIPPEMSLDRALLLEPTASALHGVKKAPLAKGEKALVIGAGTIGLLTLAVAKALYPDAEVDIVAKHDFQKRLAEKLGADRIISPGKDQTNQIAKRTVAPRHTGYLGNEILLGGYDVVYDTVGSGRTLQNALRWTKGGGRVVLLGIHFHPDQLDYSPIWNQEISVVGINCHATEDDGRTSFAWATDLLLRPEFAVESLVTHRFTMAQFKKAVTAFTDKNASRAIKIVLEHEK